MGKDAISRRITIYMNGKEVDATITNLRKNLAKFRSLATKSVEGTPEWKKYNKEVARTEIELKQAYQAQKKFKENTVLSDKSLSKMQKNLKSNQGFLSKFKAQLGPVGIGLASAFSVTAIINFGKQIFKTINLFRELKHETKLLTGLQGAMLDEAVGKTKALADTFNTDYKQNLIAANALSKQFGVSYEEALQSMENGYLAGANASGDMLNQLKEYAPLMNEANLSLDEMVALIAQTEKEGIFNDKGIDAIKEGMLRIREGTDATRKAMTGLGLDTKQVYKDLEEGNINYFEVMQLVSTKLSEVEKQSPQVGQAIADIFAGPGEDAGLQFLQGIKDIDLELNSLIDTTDEYTKAQILEIEATESLNTALAHLSETGSWWNIMLSKIKKSAGDALSATSAYIESEVSFWTKAKAALGDTDALIEISAERGAKAFKETEKQKVEDKEEAENQKVKAAQKALKKVSKLAKAAAEGEKKAQEKLLNEIKKLEEDALLAKQSLNDQEVQKIVNKYDKLLAVAVKGSEEEKKLKELKANEIHAKELQLEEQFQQQKEQIIKQYDLLSNPEKQAQELTNLKGLLDKKLLSEEQYQIAKKGIEDYWKNLKKEEAEIEAQEKADKIEEEFEYQLEYEAETDQERYGLAKQRLDDLLAQKLISEKQYEKELAKLRAFHARKQMQTTLSAITAIGAVINTAKQVELNGIREVTRRKGESEDEFLKRKEEVEEEKKQIQKKYAKAELLTSISKIGVATALAIMQAYAQLGPIGGTIAGVAISALGILQLSNAHKEYNRVQSLEDGGFTHSGPSSGGVDGRGGRTGILHPDEYVVPRHVREDPEVPRVIEYLEAKRTGQPISDAGSAPAGGESQDALFELLFESKQSIDRLNEHLDNGIKINYTLNDEQNRRDLAQKLDDTITASKGK